MSPEVFNNICNNVHEDVVNLLNSKAREYGPGGDRFNHNKKLATMLGTNPVFATVCEASKHYITICDMAKHPEDYTVETWNGRLYDMIAYLYIITALLDEVYGTDHNIPEARK